MIRVNIRQIAVAMLILAMLGILSACSDESVSSAQPKTSQDDAAGITSEEPNATKNTPSDEYGEQSESNNILISYFAVAENSDVDAISSASVRVINDEAKGHIRVLADVIQNNVGGDMFSILTSTEYPGGVNTLIDFADKEQEENARPELTTHIENLDDYDVIFIGYPNWWYDMPMVMYSFFEEYDFAGKAIVPFCTHNGSGFSNTINKIRELEPNANVLDGFTTNGKNVEEVDSDVAEWISGLGI